MAETTFRLPVAGFDQIERILRAYLAASRGSAWVPVKLDDVSKRAAMSKPAVSGNNAFLASLGLIEGGNHKQLTERGLRAALTLDHPGTPEAFRAWTDVIEASPDLERVLDAVRIRKGMDEDALLSHIVLTAGVPKNARNLTGARTIVDILEFAGLLREDDGKLTTGALPDNDYPSLSTTDVDDRLGMETGPVLAGQALATGPSRVVVNVHVWVSASEVDFEELGDDLKRLLTRLSDAS